MWEPPVLILRPETEELVVWRSVGLSVRLAQVDDQVCCSKQPQTVDAFHFLNVLWMCRQTDRQTNVHGRSHSLTHGHSRQSDHPHPPHRPPIHQPV
mmetsp:Transcript_28320/g.70755  ORF Transcript_28320/g.70755 Transcript_28320/m.70755 type:complete len:96 (-) Transcript_28320:2018-2305(-)